MSVLEFIFLAIIEGITEFLPISSTGHMIIASSVMDMNNSAFFKVFIISIQLGAILSVVVLYRKRFFQSFSFYSKLFTAFLPAAVIGYFFIDYIDILLERVEVVAVMLILGGVFFLFINKLFKNIENGKEEVSSGAALRIGFFQTLAMVPGVSRSAASIIGGLSQNLKKTAAVEFSFFLAVPTMFAATVYKLFDFYNKGNSLEVYDIYILIIGNVVAFFVAIFSIKLFISFLTRYGFSLFGYYRILMGLLILFLQFSGTEISIL